MEFSMGHSRKVALYSGLIAKELGLRSRERDLVERAALLHDVGKAEIKSAIIDKVSVLSRDEFEEIKKHPIKGVEIVGKWGRVPADVIAGIRSHHERFNGDGYPDGLVGEQIPLVGRIIAVADAFDAMRSVRPYRRELSVEEALMELRRCSFQQFDPRVVNAFLTGFEKNLRFRNSSTNS